MASYRGTEADDRWTGTDDYLETAEGLGGNDWLRGGGGMDWLYGGAGDDRLDGGDGADIFRGGSGVDVYLGSEGVDRVSFQLADATQGVVANLRTGRIQNDGYGNAERMRSIEGLGGGTVHVDRFVGDAGNNWLFCGAGDAAFGSDGDDLIDFGIVREASIRGGEGVDTIRVTGLDVQLDLSGRFQIEPAMRGVIIDLGRQRVLDDGFGNRTRYREIENAHGGEWDDRLIGSAGANELCGNFGNDRLDGAGDDDRLIGGKGQDRLTGGSGADVFAFSGFTLFLVLYDLRTSQFYADVDPADSFSTIRYADRITDFTGGTDLIDVSAVDAVIDDPDRAETHYINDAFTWLGTGAFSGAGGEARYEVRNGYTVVQFEVGIEENGGPDMMLVLTGEHALTQSDFLL